MITIYTYMVADILHIGHLQQLINAKNLGDKLIVGVLTDKATMEKKPKPILPFHERIAIMRAIKYVDIVIPQDEYSPLKNVTMLKPDILIESASHSEQPANDFMRSIHGEVIVFPYYPENTSSLIKQKIKKS